MNIHEVRMTIILAYKNTTLFILLRVKASVEWERQMDRGRKRQTTILTYNLLLFTLPCCVIFKAAFSTSASLSGSTEPEACCGPLLLAGCPSTYWHSPWLTESLVAASWDSKTETPCISHEHLHISFHNTHTFPFNYMTESAYFHWCILCRVSLIDRSVRVNMQNKCLSRLKKWISVVQTNLSKLSW